MPERSEPRRRSRPTLSTQTHTMNDLTALITETPAAAALLAAMIGFSLYGLRLAPAMVERNLFRPHWLLPQRQYKTLVTSGFLHADTTHLLVNAFTFWAFAFGLERTLGTPRFLALYVFGLLVSDAGTWLAHRREPEYRSLGASGAIMAVVFASVLYHPSSSLFILPIPYPIPAPLYAVGYLAYSFWASRQARGNINHDAHFAGALAGIGFVAFTDFDTLARALRSFFS